MNIRKCFLAVACLLSLCILLSSKAISQPALLKNVGIGTTAPDPSAILDLSADSMGFLTPRLTSAQRIAIISPARGLLVYDIDFENFWYFDGTQWIMLENASSGWSLTGNAGTVAGTNFIGTKDIQDFIFKTGGNAATNERMRILWDGHVTINNVIPNVGDLFSVYATGYPGAINAIGTTAISGYSGAGGIGLVGKNTGTGAGVVGQSTLTGVGVYGLNDNSGEGVWGDSWGTGGWGVRGQSTNNSIGVLGTNDASGVGVGALNNSTGNALVGINSSMAAGAGLAIYGQASWNTSFGLFARNTNTFGTAILGIGNNVLPLYLTNGSGGAFTGLGTGLFSLAQDNVDGTGIIAVGNYLALYNSIAGGAGIAANAFNIGVYGHATKNVNGWGGYFTNGGTAYAYVGGNNGFTDYAILSVGVKSTIVQDLDNKPVTMFCPESPEIIFQDYGTGKLVNGKTHVTLDPVFSNNIYVDDQYPLKVFVQLNGDCNGVYVANRTKDGFDIVELKNGQSNTEFTWTAIANRKDRVENGQVVSKHVGIRFPSAPSAAKEVTIKSSTLEKNVEIDKNLFNIKTAKFQVK
jgi:hypothetical protein